MMPTASRVLILGLDGGTAAAISPWIQRGLTPNLARFWSRSAHGTLHSSIPMVTPVAWTSFATGCEPPRHGIHEFYHMDPLSHSIRPNHAGLIRPPVLWEWLGAAGQSVVSINLPLSYPPPAARGIVVAGTDAPGLDWAFTQCPDFGREILAQVPDFTHKVIWKRRPRSTEELIALTTRTSAIFRAQAEVALRADRRVDWSALLVHFHNLDGLQHRIWPELELEPDAQPTPGWTGPAIAAIRALDEAVGRLLDLADRRNAAVIALSDHGFGPCRSLVNVNGLLCQAGLQRKRAYGTRIRYRARRLADRARRWLEKRSNGGGQRSARSVEGQIGCDWSRTVAFAPFGQLSANVFLTDDVRGTSAQGVIREVIDLLLDARHPETRQRLFWDAFSVAERYGIDPVAEGLPDVLAPSVDGFQAQAKWSPFCDQITRPDPNLPATHYEEGILAIDAPGIRPGPGLEAALPDVAPTILAILGHPVPAEMDGRVLHEAFESELPVLHQSPAPSYRPRMNRALAPLAPCAEEE